MPNLSIIVPAWKEPYLYKTVNNIFEKAIGDIEVIATLDGTKPEIMPKKDSRLSIIEHNTPGMRGSINAGLAVAKGKYIMKLDAHCSFMEGFDENLTAICQENWLVVPRRYSLDENTWEKNEDRPIWDYHYLSFPALIPVQWQRPEREGYELDDTMTIQGSCWLANREYFMKHVGFLDDKLETYGNFTGEQHEVSLKYWLGGGEVKVMKSVWYAHLLKKSRHYNAGVFDRSRKENKRSRKNESWVAKHWLNNEEPNMVRSFSWLVEKFMPIPSWPEDKLLWIAQ